MNSLQRLDVVRPRSIGMGVKRLSAWIFYVWFVLFVSIMLAETLYLEATGEIFTIQPAEAVEWVESWGVFAYIVDFVIFVFLYNRISQWWRKKSEGSSIDDGES